MSEKEAEQTKKIMKMRSKLNWLKERDLLASEIILAIETTMIILANILIWPVFKTFRSKLESRKLPGSVMRV